MEGAIEKIQNNNEKLREVLPQALDRALAYIRDQKDLEDLPFHNEDHTKRVVERYKFIVRALNSLDIEVGTDREVLLGEVGAMFHDTVQNLKDSHITEEIELADGQKVNLARIRRTRFSESNELASANLAVKFLKDTGVFKEGDKEIIKQQILATVAKYDENKKTVLQSNLGANSRVIDFAIAMADLGTSGIESDKFIPDGDALFREENPDITQAIEEMKKGKDIEPEYQEYYKMRMLAWCRGQVQFPLKRKEQLSLEINPIFTKAGELDEARKTKFLGTFFGGFEESSRLMDEQTQKREAMDFLTLAEDMGYKFKNKTPIKKEVIDFKPILSFKK